MIQVPASASDQEYLQFIKSSGAETNYGEDPIRFVLLSTSEELATFKDLECVKYRRIFQDLNTTAPDAVGSQYLKGLGWLCRDPGRSGLGIEIGLSNRSGVNEITPSFQAAADDYFSTVQLSQQMWLQDFSAGLAAAQSGDFEAAVSIWWPLANLGDQDSQFNLGVLFRQGWGVPQDFEQAARWYKAAADQGAIEAMANLGMLLRDGRGVPQNYVEGARLLKAAAEHGNAPAQYSLAAMYENGQGVSLDQQTALMWYYVASKNGYKSASAYLEGIVEEMKDADIDKAKERSSICMASDYADCE